MKFKNTSVLLAIVLALALAQQQALAILYGTTGSSGTASSLYTIDPTTGASTLVGAVGFNEVVSIDFDPISGTLYGIANNFFGGGAQLITINTATGVGTFVAALSPSFQSPDMSFSPSGTLYSWSEPGPDNLNTVNITTGATTDVGPSGLSTARTGLDVNSAGTIYMKNFDGNVYTINPVTGAATFVINVDAAPFDSINDFDNVLAFDQTDQLYTVDRVGGDSYLYTLDLNTGGSTLIGATGLGSLGALAFSPVSASVPDAGTTSTLLGLAMLALAAIRRKLS